MLPSYQHVPHASQPRALSLDSRACSSLALRSSVRRLQALARGFLTRRAIAEAFKKYTSILQSIDGTQPILPSLVRRMCCAENSVLTEVPTCDSQKDSGFPIIAPRIRPQQVKPHADSDHIQHDASLDTQIEEEIPRVIVVRRNVQTLDKRVQQVRKRPIRVNLE